MTGSVPAPFVVGDAVTTVSGFTGLVVALGTGQLAGLVTIALGGAKGVTVKAADVIKLRCS